MAKDVIDEFTQMMVEESLRLIGAKFSDPKQSTRASTVFVARLLGVMLFRSLSEKPPENCNTKDKKLNFVKNNFATAKVSVQEAVAAAFSGAMHTYSGVEVEYYCQIKPIPPVANKEMI